MRYSSSSRKRLQYVHICLLVSISRFYGTWNSIKLPSAIGTHRISREEWRAVSGRCTCTLLHLESAIRWSGTEERVANQRSRSYRHNVSREVRISQDRDPRELRFSSVPSHRILRYRQRRSARLNSRALLKTLVRLSSCSKAGVAPVVPASFESESIQQRYEASGIRNPISPCISATRARQSTRAYLKRKRRTDSRWFPESRYEVRDWRSLTAKNRISFGGTALSYIFLSHTHTYVYMRKHTYTRARVTIASCAS